MQKTMYLLKTDISKKLRNLLSYFILSIILSACATVSTTTAISDDAKPFDKQQIQHSLSELSDWQVEGVIGIIHDGKADRANYMWQQKGDDFSIKIYGPMGIGSVELSGNKDSVELVESNGDKVQSKDVESLLKQKLGWYVPVNGLVYWIKGLQQPDIAANPSYDKLNLLTELKQSGWDIEYQNYELVDGKYPLPSKIKMSRDNLTLKVVIKSWTV